MRKEFLKASFERSWPLDPYMDLNAFLRAGTFNTSREVQAFHKLEQYCG